MRTRRGWLGPLLALAAACHGSTALSSPDAGPAPPTTASSDVLRFLEQASFGPTDALADEVQSQGIAAYLDAQLALPPSSLGTFAIVTQSSAQLCPTGSPPGCYRDNYTAFPVTVQFFRNALTAPDQLRQRVAFALGQILVVSGADVPSTYGIAAYQQLLVNDALGSFRTLLEDVTLSPAMGRYLDMANNDKPNPAAGTHPNENYARELLQLFSIGLVQLAADGTVQQGGDGGPMPTYDQADVSELARVFTGWTYPTVPGATARPHNPAYFAGPMIAVAANHDTGAKTLFDGTTLPAGRSAQQDLDDALDRIFQHPNVGPFIGRQLIQHLVTANPSPAYVARVSAVFADDGHGARGNLGAVVRAILLDPEARGDAPTDPAFGKLREPALLFTGVARALGAASDGVMLRNASATVEQDVFNAPSVFSFYPPDTPLGGTALVSPSSQIFDSTTALARPNLIYSLLYKGAPPDATVTGATGTTVTLSALASVGADPAALVDRLDVLLLHRTMSDEVRQAIIAAVGSVDASDVTGRARMAAYLVASSPQYQVER
jgi:uncharacterized protein (DUF1800 family)